MREKLAPHGYYDVNHTPGLWRHVRRPVRFSLAVDDFDIKYVGEKNVQHLINAIQSEGYKLSIDWSGSKYCGMTLQWDYNTYANLDYINAGVCAENVGKIQT